MEFRQENNEIKRDEDDMASWVIEEDWTVEEKDLQRVLLLQLRTALKA